MATAKSNFLDNDPRFQGTSPIVKEVRQAVDEGMDFQLWVMAQAHALSKLKIFATMAKNVNEQQ